MIKSAINIIKETFRFISKKIRYKATLYRDYIKKIFKFSRSAIYNLIKDFKNTLKNSRFVVSRLVKEFRLIKFSIKDLFPFKSLPENVKSSYRIAVSKLSPEFRKYYNKILSYYKSFIDRLKNVYDSIGDRIGKVLNRIPIDKLRGLSVVKSRTSKKQSKGLFNLAISAIIAFILLLLGFLNRVRELVLRVSKLLVEIAKELYHLTVKLFNLTKTYIKLKTKQALEFVKRKSKKAVEYIKSKTKKAIKYVKEKVFRRGTKDKKVDIKKPKDVGDTKMSNKVILPKSNLPKRIPDIIDVNKMYLKKKNIRYERDNTERIILKVDLPVVQDPLQSFSKDGILWQ